MTKPRQYTGNKDPHPKARPGTIRFQETMAFLFGMKNLGIFANRPVRGGKGLSVHATGRAVDLSYRYVRGTGKGDATRGIPEGGRKQAIWWSRLLIINADLLGIELILDYFPEPYGRGWRCDRRDWVKYEVPTLAGAPKGDWLHIELSPSMADDAAAVRRAFTEIVLPN